MKIFFPSFLGFLNLKARFNRNAGVAIRFESYTYSCHAFGVRNKEQVENCNTTNKGMPPSDVGKSS